MTQRTVLRGGILAALAALALSSAMALAETPQPGADASDADAAESPAAGAGHKPAQAESAAELLVVEQAKVADSYARFKNELLKLAELSRTTDPARADLLEKAVQQISASGTDEQFRSILKLLDSDLLRDVDQAVDKQAQVQTDLNALLQLLLSENRDRRNASEKERLRQYIRQIEEYIKVQKGIQGPTERSGDLKDLSRRQRELAERTQGIAKKIAENEESKDNSGSPKDGAKPKDKDANKGPSDKAQKNHPDKSAPGKNPPGKPADGKPADGKPADGKPAGGKPDDAGQPKGSGQPGESGGGKGQKQGQGTDKPAGKPADGQPPDSASPDEQPNGRKRIEQAVENMKQARKRLDEANRKQASREQEEAVAALEKAKAELEEILRQVREEEVEKTLAMLEARFRYMLKLQQAVYDETVLLDKKGGAERDRSDEIESSRLSRREQQIMAEVDKALLLLREDGTAVAFPEALSELREDMDLVAQRLNQSKTGTATQHFEQDVIDALKELIAAMEKAQKDLQQRRGQPMQGQPADPPLVDSISELKMIRALQVRVNRRTKQYEELVHTGESSASEMLPRLRQLAEFEQKIHRIARDLHLGKNE